MIIEQVPADEWETWVGDGGVVLDIREPYEWESGVLPGAVQIRLGDLPAAAADLDPTRPTLVVCRSGARSHQAAIYLQAVGFEKVANLAGGMKALGLQD